MRLEIRKDTPCEATVVRRRLRAARKMGDENGEILIARRRRAKRTNRLVDQVVTIRRTVREGMHHTDTELISQ